MIVHETAIHQMTVQYNPCDAVCAKLSEDLSVIQTDKKFYTTDHPCIKKINYGTSHGTLQTFGLEKIVSCQSNQNFTSHYCWTDDILERPVI